MKRFLILSFLTVFLAVSCAAPNKMGWTKPGFRQGQFEKDREECMETAVKEESYSRTSGVFGYCMFKKGYQYETPSESPSITEVAKTPKRIYTGEALPKEKVAIIEGSKNLIFIYYIFGSWSRATKALIRQVDDKTLSDPTKKCEVLPGLHNIVVEVKRSEKEFVYYVAKEFHVRRTVPLQFNAIAGHKYRIKIEKGKYLMAVDTHSGEVVAKNPVYLREDPFGDTSTLQQKDDLRMSSEANWLGGFCGFFEGSPPNNVRIRNLQVGTPGVLMATDTQLSFLAWDGNRYMYMPLFEIGYEKITKAEVERYGLGEKLVLFKKLVVICKTKDCYSFKLKKRNAIQIADLISSKRGEK